MAERHYNATQLVALPRLKAHELLALARALIAAAKKQGELAPAVAAALADMEEAAAALAETLGSRDRKAAVSVRDADRVEDNAVGALVDVCKAWQRLPREQFPEEVAIAEACLAVFLEDGTLGFLTFKPMVEHSEVQRRLDRLAAKGVDRDLRSIGMGPFLDHLHAAHAAYGEACGASAAMAKEEPAAVGGAASEATDSMCEYVVSVVASVARKRPETQERADVLLEPLRAWVSAAPKTQAEGEAEEPAKEPAVTKDAPPKVPTNAPPANDAAEEARRKVG